MSKDSTIKAIIFDMDGTLIDSTPIEYDAWQRTFAAYGVTLNYQEYIDALGTKSIELVKMYLPRLEPSEWVRASERKHEHIKELIRTRGIQLMPQAERFLQEVKQYPLKMALATSSRRDKVDFIFEQLPLDDYFDVVVTGDDVKNGKPDPEIFLKAARQLSLSPSEVIVVEDAENGIQAARNANMWCMAISSSLQKEKLQKADLIFDSYRQLDLEGVVEKVRSTRYDV